MVPCLNVSASMFVCTPEDGAAADQAVGEVKAHQTFDRYGP
jgi:hypothetical protein